MGMWWGCGGFIALLSSREEGGAVADLLIANKVNGSCVDDVSLVPAIVDLGLGKSSKELSNYSTECLIHRKAHFFAI